MVQALRAANLQEELWVAYQPIVDVDTGMTYAMEALARWNNCSLGPVSPAVFIPSAERSGMMSQLTPVLLRKALADACDWPGDVRLSFNLSVFDICSPASILGVSGHRARERIPTLAVRFRGDRDGRHARL